MLRTLALTFLLRPVRVALGALVLGWAAVHYLPLLLPTLLPLIFLLLLFRYVLRS